MQVPMLNTKIVTSKNLPFRKQHLEEKTNLNAQVRELNNKLSKLGIQVHYKSIVRGKSLKLFAVANFSGIEVNLDNWIAKCLVELSKIEPKESIKALPPRIFIGRLSNNEVAEMHTEFSFENHPLTITFVKGEGIKFANNSVRVKSAETAKFVFQSIKSAANINYLLAEITEMTSKDYLENFNKLNKEIFKKKSTESLDKVRELFVIRRENFFNVDCTEEEKEANLHQFVQEVSPLLEKFFSSLTIAGFEFTNKDTKFKILKFKNKDIVTFNKFYLFELEYVKDRIERALEFSEDDLKVSLARKLFKGN